MNTHTFVYTCVYEHTYTHVYMPTAHIHNPQWWTTQLYYSAALEGTCIHVPGINSQNNLDHKWWANQPHEHMLRVRNNRWDTSHGVYKHLKIKAYHTLVYSSARISKNLMWQTWNQKLLLYLHVWLVMKTVMKYFVTILVCLKWMCISSDTLHYWLLIKRGTEWNGMG